MDLSDALECGAESVIKSYLRKELIREGVDVDNWQRKTASVLTGSLGALVGGLMGGPLGFLLGTMFWGIAQSAQYTGDRSPDELKRKYREAARIKAIEKSVQIIADQSLAELHPKFRKAFFAARDQYASIDRSFNSYTLKSEVRRILAGVDYSSAAKFDKLYSAAVDIIG